MCCLMVILIVSAMLVASRSLSLVKQFHCKGSVFYSYKSIAKSLEFYITIYMYNKQYNVVICKLEKTLFHLSIWATSHIFSASMQTL